MLTHEIDETSGSCGFVDGDGSTGGATAIDY
jgi:hypothetical protein